MKDIKKLRLNHQDWTVKFVTKKDMPDKLWGDANDETKVLRVRGALSGQNWLDTLLHEMLHAANFTCFSEEFVESTATEMAKAIVKSGRMRFIDD